MNITFIVFIVSLSFGFVTCEKCSEDLHETFKREFRVAKTCQDCEILNPGIFSQGENWAGFCTEGQLFLFRNWPCGLEVGGMDLLGSLAVVTEDTCDLVEWKRDFNEKCLRMFNTERCTDGSETIATKKLTNNKNNKKSKSVREKPFIQNLSASIQDSHVKPTITPPTTSSSSTEPPLTIGTTTISSTCSTTLPTPEISTNQRVEPTKNDFPTSTTPEVAVMENCEKNEYYFNDHCYFLKSYNEFSNMNLENKSISLSRINSSKICQSYHPKALGLAVETKKENDFCFEKFNDKTSFFLTSGVREQDGLDEWRGWNTKINRSIINVTTFNSSRLSPQFYCFSSRKWYVIDTVQMVDIIKNLHVVCERPYNPKNIQLNLHERCLEMYRNSSCYSSQKHTNYCCEMDETGEMWFACADSVRMKLYPNKIKCRWECTADGVYRYDRPTCSGDNSCLAFYNSIKYVAPVMRYAISGCPQHHIGYSTWFCSRNKTFLGKPDYSLCCKNTKLQCRDTDTFLNTWISCPLKTVVKITTCPPGSVFRKAKAEWYCQRNGVFLGSSPDYSACNLNKVGCSKTDSFNRTWMADPGTIAMKDCPPHFTGKCFWKCKTCGHFDGPEPDCSACEAEWMNEIADKIRNQTDHEIVMDVMENYTKNEDLRIGYNHVLKLTAACVGLFKNQTSECKFTVFEKFLKSYSRILKNVAGNPNIWSSFSEPNRREYTDKIVSTTQTAAFANLEIKNSTPTIFNETFAKSEEDGFDFFVAYNPSAGARFPLHNFTESDWQLNIIEIGQEKLNFAAMGLVMSYSLSSLMFPKGNESEHLEINSPAITFTVAASRNGEVVVDPNVMVSVTFKHIKQTRMPDSEVIRRRLHPGEQPSGVFNSTLCFYYRDSDWSTEGCSVTSTSKYQTSCTCNHLSTIGLLMSIHKYQPNETLEVISTVSSGITIIALILALLVFYFFDSVTNERVLIGINLCICLLIGHGLLITVIDKKFFNIPDNLCTFWAIVLHYTFMAAFSWMFVEGCHLYRMLIVIFDSNIEYRRIYLLIGYGMPFLIVGVTYIFGFILNEQPYGQDELCWLKTPNFVWAFVGPVIVLTSINFLILVVAMKLAISSKRRTGKSSFKSLTLWKGWVSLSALLGITWLFGFAYIHYHEPLVYVFVFLNGLQGFFIFIFRCVLCEQYKTAFLKKIKSCFSKTEFKDPKKTQNMRSETKVCVISASKSLSETKDSGFDPGINGSDYQKNTKKVEKSKLPRTSEKSSSGVDEDITLTPAASEAYLRNKMIAKNFSLRKSKAKWLDESENFPELSYHDLHLK